jgi:acyl-CoA synthetase (AMP-forming)/AMP-acid ligase II
MGQDDRVVVIDPGAGDALTVARMDDRIAEIAMRLRKRGLLPGDEIVVCLRSAGDLLVVAQGAIAAGGVVILLTAGSGPYDHLRASDARMMVADVPEAVTAAEDSQIRQVLAPTELRGS